MYLVIGLGNPDKKYEKTFHNMGFIAIGDVADTLGARFKDKECEASVATAYVKGEKVVLARPLTYMNASGRAVKQLVAKYKTEPDRLIVIYDDYDLPKGSVRIRPNGSAGSHNGMRSIIAELGFSDFARVRIGIRDREEVPLIDYVLSEVAKIDYPLFSEACKSAAAAVCDFVSGESVEGIMTKYNRIEHGE